MGRRKFVRARRGRRVVPSGWEQLESRLPLDAGGAAAVSSAIEPGSPLWWVQGGFQPVPADFDGDRRADLALFNADAIEWLISGTTAGPMGFRFGNRSGVAPVPGDYDGDGRDELAIYRFDNQNWTIRQADGSRQSFRPGVAAAGDLPAPADYDGDGKADLVSFRPAEGRWLGTLSGGGSYDVLFGAPNRVDIPVPADYDGDGRADLAVFRPYEGRWLIQMTGGGSIDRLYGAPFLIDLPAPADYDGDGRADLGLYRTSTHQWLIDRSKLGGAIVGFDPTVIPVSRIDDGVWDQLNKQYLARAASGPTDVVFLGDSITEFWVTYGQAAWNSEFAPLGAVNFGIRADTSRNVLRRVLDGSVAGRPKVVVLMIGVNDMLAYNQSPESTASAIVATVAEIRRLSQRSSVLLMGVLPASIAPATPSRANISELNRRLSGLDDGRKVRFLDVGASFLTATGTLNFSYYFDEIHLNAAGYRQLAALLRPTLLGLLAQASETPRVDYDGDGRSDLAVFRPATGQWLGALSGGSSLFSTFGAQYLVDIPVPADYDGDGRSDLAVFRASTGQWFAKLSKGGSIGLTFGAPNLVDLPVPADYDGDGHVDLAVFRPDTGQWIGMLSGGGSLLKTFGASRLVDIPVPADYDGDGKADLAVYRHSTGQWLVTLSGGGSISRYFGIPNLVDIPVPGDYDGDGKADLAVFRTTTAEWLASLSGGGVSIRTFGGGNWIDYPLATSIAALKALAARGVRAAGTSDPVTSRQEPDVPPIVVGPKTRPGAWPTRRALRTNAQADDVPVAAITDLPAPMPRFRRRRTGR